jgi:hypothetical protein
MNRPRVPSDFERELEARWAGTYPHALQRCLELEAAFLVTAQSARVVAPAGWRQHLASLRLRELHALVGALLQRYPERKTL